MLLKLEQIDAFLFNEIYWSYNKNNIEYKQPLGHSCFKVYQIDSASASVHQQLKAHCYVSSSRCVCVVFPRRSLCVGALFFIGKMWWPFGLFKASLKMCQILVDINSIPKSDCLLKVWITEQNTRRIFKEQCFLEWGTLVSHWN